MQTYTEPEEFAKQVKKRRDKMRKAELKKGEKPQEIQPVVNPIMDDQWHL